VGSLLAVSGQASMVRQRSGVAVPQVRAEDSDMPTDPIKHVVVLMLENHSFDQMLGSFRSVFPDLEGVDPARPGSNRDKDGTAYPQAVTTATAVRHDPMHELANVLHQLDGGNGNFVLDYSEAFPATIPDERQQIMGYFAPGSLPALHELARHFTICDHWYSSVPGPTWANRFFVHSGTSLGRVRMPENLNDSLLSAVSIMSSVQSVVAASGCVVASDTAALPRGASNGDSGCGGYAPDQGGSRAGSAGRRSAPAPAAPSTPGSGFFPRLVSCVRNQVARSDWV
jgi:phospholipase C